LTDGTFFLRNASGWFPKSPAVWETDDKTAGEQAGNLEISENLANFKEFFDKIFLFRE